MTEIITRADPADAGCWIDGWWGQYGAARLVELALGCGWVDAEAADLSARHLATMGPSDAEALTDDEHETLMDAADDAEAWLSAHVAPEGYSFGWADGEFFLGSADWWEES